MYDMYPSSAPYTEDSRFTERGASGLGHPEYYPIFVTPRYQEVESRPTTSVRPEQAAQPALQGAEVTVSEVDEVQ